MLDLLGVGQGFQKVDWRAVRLMFATGSTHEQISAATGIKLGTITARSSRESWKDDREKVQARVNEVARQNHDLITRTLKQRGTDWQARIATVSEKSLRVLEGEDPDTLKGVDKLSTVLEKVDRIARKTFGLDDESAKGNTIVNLGFLGDYAPERATVIESESPRLESPEPELASL